jgi:hypothetical protein
VHGEDSNGDGKNEEIFVDITFFGVAGEKVK